MKQIKLNDNSFYTREIFESVPDLFEKIVNKSLRQLEKEGIFVFSDGVKAAEDISDEQYVLKSSDGKYYTGNIMGFFGYHDEYIVIGSRFSDDCDDYFLKYLMEKALDVPNSLNLNTTFSADEHMFEFYMFLFPSFLKSAMRKGIYKSYVLNEYNDANIRGTIDIKRHLRLNTPFLGNIAYNQKEFSYDNHITQLIRHTVEFMKKNPRYSVLLRNVRDEVADVINSTPSYKPSYRHKVIANNRKNKLKHAYFHEYQKLQTLCLLILNRGKCQIGYGIEEISGVIFDGAWLWEEYINVLICDLFYHPKNKAHDGTQHLFYNKLGRIYPDFMSRNSQNRIIADAKYKPIRNIGNKDYLQVLAYMYRFDAKCGVYFYPEISDIDSVILYLNQGSTYEKNVCPRNDICLKKLGLKLSNGADSYEQYKHLMLQAESEFMLNVKNIIGCQ